MFRFVIIGSLLIVGCCQSGKKTCGNQIEVINIDISYREETRKVPIYCCLSIQEDTQYFVKNSYTLNLPEGWTLQSKKTFYLRKNKNDDTFYFSSVATNSYPPKHYMDFQILNAEKKVENDIKLPAWYND
jgi:hypothetical protein